MAQERPPMERYFMELALQVRRRANCAGNKVGAVLVREERVISTGYNGTPEDMKNCTEGGCERCARRAEFGPGKGYDMCICLHAEQNALLSAARFGIPVEGTFMYSTMKPCFNCLKEMAQVHVQGIYFVHDWQPDDPGFQRQYEILEGRIPKGVKQLAVEDPQKEWAVSKPEPPVPS